MGGEGAARRCPMLQDQAYRELLLHAFVLGLEILVVLLLTAGR